MKLKLSMAAGAAAVVFAVPAAANEFNHYDMNRDGTISQSEWNQARTQEQQQQQQQSSASQGRSGAAAPGPVTVVTILPFDQQLVTEQQRESLFRTLDTNSNGAISPLEAGVNVQLVNAFAQLDRDGNGRIERQEFKRVHVQDQQQGSAQAQAGKAGRNQEQSSSSGGTVYSGNSPSQRGPTSDARGD